MNTFIEQNKKLLLFYYWAARIGGWIFLSFATLAGIGHSIASASRISDSNEFYRYCQHDVPWGTFSDGLPTALVAIVISQLIWYLLKTDRRPPMILRNSYKLLYAYTAFLIGYCCWASVIDVRSHFNEPHDFPWRMILLAMFILVKLLALVGVAEILRRMLPVIDESRTLV